MRVARGYANRVRLDIVNTAEVFKQGGCGCVEDFLVAFVIASVKLVFWG